MFEIASLSLLILEVAISRPTVFFFDSPVASALDNQRSAQIQAGLVPLALTPPPTSPAAHHEVPQEGLQDLNTGQISGNEPQQERDQATGSYSPEGPVLVNKGTNKNK